MRVSCRINNTGKQGYPHHGNGRAVDLRGFDRVYIGGRKGIGFVEISSRLQCTAIFFGVATAFNIHYASVQDTIRRHNGNQHNLVRPLYNDRL